MVKIVIDLMWVTDCGINRSVNRRSVQLDQYTLVVQNAYLTNRHCQVSRCLTRPGVVQVEMTGELTYHQNVRWFCE